MSTFRRLELWSNLQCASGTRQAIVPTLFALTDTRSITGEESLDAVIGYDAGLMALLTEWKVLRVVYADDTFDEWRITDIEEARQDGAPVVTVKAAWPSIDLATRGYVCRTETDGLARPDFEALGLTVSAHWSAYLSPALTDGGVTYFALGTVTPTWPVNLVYDWMTPLQALKQLADQTGMELQVRRNGTTQYLVDLVTAIGGSAPTVLFRASRNLLGVKRSRSAVDLVTRALPRGTHEDGMAATMAHARWQVTAVDTGNDDVTLADPVGGDGPVLYDDQLNGLYLRRPSGTLDAITDTFVATQKVRVADASVYAVNDLVEVRRTSAGDQLLYLENPTAKTAYGVKVAVLDRPDIPSTLNLCPNPAQRAWAGASSVPADSWAKVGTCTVTKTTTGTRTRVGGQSTRVETAADGAGIEVNNGTVAPTTASPYFSGYVSVQLTSGKVRVELVVSDGSTTWVIPNGTEGKAWTNVVDVWVDLGVAGIDLKALGTGAITARLRVVQDGAGTADFYVDSAQITQSAGQLPFIEGSGGTQLWQEANRLLERASAPSVRYDVDILDLNRLNGVTWAADALALGGTVKVYDADLGMDATTRVLNLKRDLLTDANTNCVLSNRPEDLTDVLVRPTRARRQVRNAESGATPVITPFYQRVNGSPYQIQVTLQATPPGCTVYRWVGLSSDAVPAAGSASYTAYSAPFVVDLAGSATYNSVVACYAVIGNRQSPVQTFQLPLSPAPEVTLSLTEPVAGMLRIQWIPNAWVRRVRLYRRKHATDWPTDDGTTTGILDNTYFIGEYNVVSDAGGFDAAGAPITGGTGPVDNTGWANGEIARVIVVPLDELDNVGTRATATRTMQVAVSPAIAVISNNAQSNGSSCASGGQRNFIWTPNAAVADGTHDLKVYVAVNGGTPVLLFTETSPATTTSRNAVTIPTVDACSSYHEGSGTEYVFSFTYELIQTSGSVVVDSGLVKNTWRPRNTCAL